MGERPVWKRSRLVLRSETGEDVLDGRGVRARCAEKKDRCHWHVEVEGIGVDYLIAIDSHSRLLQKTTPLLEASLELALGRRRKKWFRDGLKVACLGFISDITEAWQ